MQRAIAAIIQSKSVAEAARISGIPQRTLWRWIYERPDFQAALDEAQREIYRSIQCQLFKTSDEALEVVRSILADGKVHPSTRVRAALGVLDGLMRMRQLELSERQVGQADTALAIAFTDVLSRLEAQKPQEDTETPSEAPEKP